MNKRTIWEGWGIGTTKKRETENAYKELRRYEFKRGYSRGYRARMNWEKKNEITWNWDKASNQTN